MALKHRSNTELPDLSVVEGKGNQDFDRQIVRLLQSTFKNIYDDLNATRSLGTIYFGDEGTNGTWRIVATSTRFSIQLREAGVWNEKIFASP